MEIYINSIDQNLANKVYLIISVCASNRNSSNNNESLEKKEEEKKQKSEKKILNVLYLYTEKNTHFF